MIPKIFHFIYFPGPKIPNLVLCHYLSIKSNIEVNRPDKVYFYTTAGTIDPMHEQTNKYLRMLQDEYPGVFEVIGLDTKLTEYLGNPINFDAHRGDILRTLIMLRQGGVYSDIDSIATNPIPEDWYTSDVPIMCTEDRDGVPCGLCNGFFLAPKDSEFLKLVLSQYKDYYFPEDKNEWVYEWAEFSVIRPWKLYQDNKDLVRVVPARCFQPIYLDYKSTQDLYFLDREIPSGHYQVHLWENRNHDIMKVLDEQYFIESNTTLTKLCKRWINCY